MSEIQSLLKLKDGLKVRVDEIPNRMTTRLTWSSCGMHYSREVDDMELYNLQMDAYQVQNNPMYYYHSASTTGLNMYTGQSVPVSRQEDLMCVGNGWGNLQSAPMMQQYFNHVSKKVMKFFRINEEVELEEGGTYVEPLDQLRLKVKRWLKGEI